MPGVITPEPLNRHSHSEAGRARSKGHSPGSGLGVLQGREAHSRVEDGRWETEGKTRRGGVG